MPLIQLDQVRLYYECAGDGEPLLLLHGLGSSTRDWEYQVPYLAERYRVVTLDLRGHGASDKPPGPYSRRLFADDIARFIRSLDLAPAHVLGLSLGGFVACRLAMDHADLVRTLVMVNSVPDLPRERFRDRVRINWTLLVRRLIVRMFGMRALGRLLGRKLFPRPEQTPLRQTFIERWAKNDPRAYLDSLALVADQHPDQRLDAIRCPTCLISGEHDYLPLALKERFVARLADARLIVIPDSGHFTPIDAPRRFNEAVIECLSGCR